MNNKVVVCDIGWSDGIKYVDWIAITYLDQLEDKYTHKEITDGIYDYYMYNLKVRDVQPTEYISFDNIEKDVFVLYGGSSDTIIILDTSKYYKWFMFFNTTDRSITENRIINQLADIILDNVNKELIVYKRGVRVR